VTGGTLTNLSGTVTYGTFTSTGAGQFALTLTWDAINALQAITFVGNTSVSYEATFRDSLSNTVAGDVTLELLCGNGASPNGACSGTCVDLTSSDNCGACGATCSASVGATCTSPGICAFTTDINAGNAPVTFSDRNVTCAASCAQATAGATCTSATADLLDGTSVPMSCTQSAATYPVSTTTPFTTSDFICECTIFDNYYKSDIGSCASICSSAGETSCMGLLAEGNGFQLAEPCSAPYLYGDWDNLVANLDETSDGGVLGENPSTFNLSDVPVDIGCNCQVAATP
jgi:hypothetical protein